MSALPQGFHIIEPATPQELEQYYHLRWLTLRKPWNRPKGSEKDDSEEGSLHAMIMDEMDEPVAVCRLQFVENNVGQIRSMGVKEEYRSKGLGRLIISYMEDSAKAKGLSSIVLDAREQAVGFYKKQGYEVTAKSYLLFGEIQHWRMKKNLQDHAH